MSEPAFPTQMWDIENKEATWLDGGLTKRELGAFLCLQGLLASGQGGEKEMKVMAAIIYADMLLEDLGKNDRK